MHIWMYVCVRCCDAPILFYSIVSYRIVSYPIIDNSLYFPSECECSVRERVRHLRHRADRAAAHALSAEPAAHGATGLRGGERIRIRHCSWIPDRDR